MWQLRTKAPCPGRVPLFARRSNSSDTALIEEDEASVMFADLVGYTAASSRLSPVDVMRMLHRLYDEFDHAATELGAYKLDTIGGEAESPAFASAGRGPPGDTAPKIWHADAYMACTGLSFMGQPDHVDRILLLASDLLRLASRFFYPESTTPVQLRVGIGTGYVASGLMGSIRRKFTVTGATVNMVRPCIQYRKQPFTVLLLTCKPQLESAQASRMESTGEPGMIHVTQAVRDASRLPRECFRPVVSHVKAGCQAALCPRWCFQTNPLPSPCRPGHGRDGHMAAIAGGRGPDPLWGSPNTYQDPR